MFDFSWLRRFFVRELNEEANVIDRELEALVEARAAKIMDRLTSRIERKLIEARTGDVIDVEWEPGVPQRFVKALPAPNGQASPAGRLKSFFATGEKPKRKYVRKAEQNGTAEQPKRKRGRPRKNPVTA